MSRRPFDSTENAELQAKIEKAKRSLPMPELMKQLGLGEHAKKVAHCPWHSDENPSFSVFQSKNGKGWQWKCHAGCGYGDEIAFLVKHFNISRREAIRRYLEMAGFPAGRIPKSHEYPKSLEPPKFPESRECREFPESPVCPVSPVSEGQVLDGEVDKLLKALAAQNTCTQLNTARTRRFKLLRDLKAVEKQIGHRLQIAELTIAFDEWHQLSLRFLDPAKTRDYYEAKFLCEFSKVRFATGEGMLATALENVARLSHDQLPTIPGKPSAPENWRRLAALHRELDRLCGIPTYFLAYRDAAKICDRLSHQEAHAITGALETLGVIKIVSKGDARLNGGKAAEFRYLLPQPSQMENGADEDDVGFEL